MYYQLTREEAKVQPYILGQWCKLSQNGVHFTAIKKKLYLYYIYPQNGECMKSKKKNMFFPVRFFLVAYLEIKLLCTDH